ncbi:MAG: hypothetical protein ACJ8GW_16275 [Massilia sp.]
MTKEKLTLSLVLALCASIGLAAPTAPEAIYRGEYFYNFEDSYLTPTGKTEAWCISSDMSKAMLPAKNGSAAWGTSSVVLRGRLGPTGHFGGLGRCTRVLEVIEIIEVKSMRGREKASASQLHS